MGTLFVILLINNITQTRANTSNSEFWAADNSESSNFRVDSGEVKRYAVVSLTMSDATYPLKKQNGRWYFGNF
jgi:hypothetical protein